MADVNDRLIVELETKLDKLDSGMRKAVAIFASSNDNMARKAAETTTRIESLFGKMDIDKAVGRTFDRTRFAALEAGGAKIPIFGSALEELGAAGLIAAAGVGAAALAMSKAKEAGEDVEKLAHSAAELGIAATSLQEFQYAGAAVGISPEQTRSSLEALNAMLGAIQAGEPRAKIFKEELGAIGFSSAQIAGFKTVEDFLPAFADKIRDAGSVAEQARITDRLGLKELQPLLEKGSSGLADLRTAFRNTGIEIDNSMIAKTEVLNEKMDEADAKLSGSVTKALLSLEGPLAAVKGWLADLVLGFSEVNDKIGGFFAKQSGVAQYAKEYSTALTQIEGIKSGKLGALVDNGLLFSSQKQKNTKIAQLQSDADYAYGMMQKSNAEWLASQAPASPSSSGAPSARTLITPKAKKSGDPEGHINEVTSRVSEMLDEAQKELASAQASLTQNILQHAALEKAAVDDETKDRADKLNAEKAAVDGDKKLSAAQKTKLDAELAIAIADNTAAAIAKKALIDREAENKIIEDRLAHEREIADYATSILSDAESLADTSQQRRSIALAQLAIEQQQQQAELQNKNRLAIQQAGSDPQAIAAAQALAAQSQAGLNAVQGAQTASALQNTASPGNAYTANLNKTYGGSLTDQFQNIDVSGINSLGDALDAVLLKTKTAKQAFHEWALSVTKDLLSLATKDLVERPLANLLFPGNSANTGGAQSVSTAAAATSLSGLTVSATSAALALEQIAGLGGASSLAGAAGTGSGSGGLGLLGGVASVLRFIPGFASGTDSAPGGAAWVGENGPELINLPRGSTVTNMDALKAARNVSPSSVRVTQSTYSPRFDLSGAVMTEDLVNQMNVMAERHGQAAVAQAVQLARVATRDDMNKRGRQSWAR